MAAVRAELLGLKTGLLRQRARAAGVNMDRFNEAVDADDKPAMVQLVVAAEGMAERMAAAEAEAAALRADLAGAKTGVLRKRARVEGVDMDKVEEAIDEDDKATIIELIVAAAAAAATVGGGGGGGAADRPPEGVPPELETKSVPKTSEEALVAWLNTFPAVSVPVDNLMDLKDGVALAAGGIKRDDGSLTHRHPCQDRMDQTRRRPEVASGCEEYQALCRVHPELLSCRGPQLPQAGSHRGWQLCRGHPGAVLDGPGLRHEEHEHTGRRSPGADHRDG